MHDAQQLHDVTLTAFELPDFSDILTDAKTSFSDLGIAFKDLVGAFSDPSEALENLQTALATIAFQQGDQKTFLFGDPNLDPPGAVTYSNDSLHSLIFGIVTDPENPLSPGDPGILPENIVPIVNLLSSPLSGALFGAVSPFVAPVVPFLNPLMELIVDLQTQTSPDFGQLGTELLEAPFNSIFGLFAGSTLNLDPLLPAISGALPEGFSITGLSLAFGGLLSPGETILGPGNEIDFDTSTVIAPGAGGSIFNALGLDTLLNIPAQGVGPIGGFAGLVEAVAAALSGNLPPLQPPDSTEAVDPGLFSNFFDSVGLDQLGSDFASVGL